jgi:proteasome accessory factor C
MQLPGADPDGPLGRGLAKLATALGEDDTAGVRVDLERPELADRLAEAISSGIRLRIDYWSASRDELTTRAIVPRQLYSDRGEWYVSADDDRSGEVRTFRVDRIEAMEATGEAAGQQAIGELPTPGEWFTDASIPRVTLRLAPPAHWIVERYPADEVGEPDADGWLTARLPVASQRWFVRTMLRLGPNAEVLEPAGVVDEIGAAAARVLERYRS